VGVAHRVRAELRGDDVAEIVVNVGEHLVSFLTASMTGTFDSLEN
jgi:hypothetical protein